MVSFTARTSGVFFKSASARTLNNYRNFFIGFFLFLIVTIFYIVFHLIPSTKKRNQFGHLQLDDYEYMPEVFVDDESPVSDYRNKECTYWDCFNVYRCSDSGTNRMSVYVYPFKKYTDSKGNSIGGVMSREFYYLLKTIIKSKYYTPNPEDACILVPSIDLLNQNRIPLKLTSQVLQSLPYWNNGENHLIFNMLPGAPPMYNTVLDLPTANAVIAGAGFDSWTFREDFDVSLPMFSPEATTLNLTQPPVKKITILSPQFNILDEHYVELKKLADAKELTLLIDCKTDEETATNYDMRCDYKTGVQYAYPDVMKQATFCIVIRSVRLAQSYLLDALAAGCIPIIIADTAITPFFPLIDWHRTALFIYEDYIHTIPEIARNVSIERKDEMLKQTRWLYDRYFSSMEKITKTALDIINERLFVLTEKSYEDWNIPPWVYVDRNPLFLPITAQKAPGFTAVILTYDRLESLYTLINKLSKTPSLSKIIVVWNNQKKDPPPTSQWPSIKKPLKVIRTKENKLSNRFFPYPEIETECQLTLDDDIIMLTSDELEFGFQVWREFPDRIVGFPSRLHLWDNKTNAWKYDSEWTNEISMVLTGAAFHHKLWSWYYTYKMPAEIRDWVDQRFNCEDIAMNFLVANVTNKAPIKVAPRKKFKCPECTNTEMLSADLGHMTERSDCINRFAKIYGKMVLKTIEFRADPVLYKDDFPQKLKWFNDIGSL